MAWSDDRNCARFLETLAEACAKTEWQVHAFCLMPNHFQLVFETPPPNLVAGIKSFLGTYTARFNRRHWAADAPSHSEREGNIPTDLATGFLDSHRFGNTLRPCLRTTITVPAGLGLPVLHEEAICPGHFPDRFY